MKVKDIKMLKNKKTNEEFKYLIITDIGSTTTKGLLLEKKDSGYYKIAIANEPTTVEKPKEDVKIGIKSVIRKLEKKSKKQLLNSTKEQIKLREKISYLTTSSAGGGLQILVVGLTSFDTASSAKRAAFGAGGVILDTFAIDDKRTAIEQMEDMNILHPDLILFSGGIDDGALSGVVRLAEILSLANPNPKFKQTEKIPLIFAGNKEAVPFIKSSFSEQFALEIIPNIRPTMREENLEPATKKIHQLFLDNVMERAPGYSALKKLANDDIIPTPYGVLKSLEILGKSQNKNILSFDLGGATTDMFSNIQGKFFRTVSANIGMSYSCANVLSETEYKNIAKWLPSDYQEDVVRNYISNKTLYPNYLPENKSEQLIEKSIAKNAIYLAKKQHFAMNFETEQVGFLNKMHNKFKGKLSLEIIFNKLKNVKFQYKDLDIFIACGGIISHTDNPVETILMINDSLEPLGFTEIWKDRHFHTPHIGKLSQINQKAAQTYLLEQCFEKLAFIISPIKIPQIDTDILQITLEGLNKTKQINIKSEELKYIPNPENKKLKLKIKKHKKVIIQHKDEKLKFEIDMPILIDTRTVKNFDSERHLYKNFQEKEQLPKKSLEENYQKLVLHPEIKKEKSEIEIALPYAGTLNVQKGDKVKPDSLIGVNKYQPPKIFIIPLFKDPRKKLNSTLMKKYIRVKEGDEIRVGTTLISMPSNVKEDGEIDKSISAKLQKWHYNLKSNVRGKITKINFDSGMIIAREIQDYSTKPVKVKIAPKLGVPPNKIKKYMRKNIKDFVHRDDIIASRLSGRFMTDEEKTHAEDDKALSSNSFLSYQNLMNQKGAFMVKSPTAGTLTNIDTEKGSVTIEYQFKEKKKYANLYGKVLNTKNNTAVTINYNGYKIQGIIGFGKENHGIIHFISDELQTDNLKNKIVISSSKIDKDLLQKLINEKVAGLITPSIDNSVITKHIDKEIGIALTGRENIAFPIIITEGFGNFNMRKEYQEFLKNSHGKFCYMNPHTQIRAGVTRPTIIIQEIR